MVNENVIGRMRCPCCGEEHQDVKVNKNGNLYMICDNSCRVNFSPKQTRTFKPSLMAGQSVNVNGLIIKSIKGVQNGTDTIRATKTARQSANAGEFGGNPTIGRTNGELTGDAGRTQPKPASVAGGFISWLSSDDDE